MASVLRLLSAGLILLSIVLLALLWLAHKRHAGVGAGPEAAADPWWRWILYALPALTGLLLWIFSRPLSTRLTRDFD